jgi:hypothetical protein
MTTITKTPCMKRFLNAVMVATLAFGFVLHVEPRKGAKKQLLL